MEDKRSFFPTRHGETCPTCGQYAKRYKRTITWAMATGLIMLYTKTLDKDLFDPWLHIDNFRTWKGISVLEGGDFAKLEHWGLIQAKKNYNSSKRCSGVWRITEDGRAFVLGKLHVYSYVWLYNNKLLMHDGEKELNIHKALKKKFDYGELMRGEL